MWRLGDPIPGFGKSAQGHMVGGAQTLTVTSGADSGPGTLREYCENTTGPRLIQFAPDVRDIQLSSALGVNNGPLTIDGHSAGGVQVRGAPVNWRASNSICVGKQFRCGGPDSSPNTGDSLVISGSQAPLRDVAFINCSMQWGVDECVDIYRDVARVSILWSIISEGLNSTSKYGMLIANTPTPHEISIIENLFAFHTRRCPRIANGDRIEILNNHFFGIKRTAVAIKLAATNNGVGEVYIGGNCLRLGPESDADTTFIDAEMGTLYLGSNRMEDVTGSVISLPYHKGAASIVRAAPSWTSHSPMGPSLIRDHVLSVAGAYPADRDDLDARIIQQCADSVGGVVDWGDAMVAYPPKPTFSPPPPPSTCEDDLAAVQALLAAAQSRIVELEDAMLALQQDYDDAQSEANDLAAELARVTNRLDMAKSSWSALRAVLES